MEYMMKLVVTVILCSILLGSSTAEDKTGCIGDSYYCCQQVELFPEDTLTLKTSGPPTFRIWCDDKMIMARRTLEESDICPGCTLTVNFTKHSDPFPPTVILSQTNYSTAIFYVNEFLSFEPMATYGGKSGNEFPESVTTNSTVLQLSYVDTSDFEGELEMVITVNAPELVIAGGTIFNTTPGLLLVCFLIVYSTLYY